jgi:hypothetical protein
MEDRAWDHHFTSGGEQYGGWESWHLQGREGGDQYRPWNDHNQGRAPQYTEVRNTWGGKEGSYNEDHYPYVRRDVVDDTVHEEDFQDVHDEDTMSLNTLLIMAMFMTGRSVIQCLLLSALVNGMMRGSFVHGPLEMT